MTSATALSPHAIFIHHDGTFEVRQPLRTPNGEFVEHIREPVSATEFIAGAELHPQALRPPERRWRMVNTRDIAPETHGVQIWVEV